MTLDNQLKALTAQGEPLDSALYKQIQQQSAQEKFNNAIEKLSSLLGDIVAGPLGKLIDGFSDLVKSAGGLYTIMGVLLAGKIVSVISSIRQQVALQRTLTILAEGEAAAKTVSAAAISFGALVPVVLAAGIAAYSLFASKSMDDGELGPNGKILYTAQEGAIRLNDNDKVAVGTNLFSSSNNNNMALVNAIKDAITSGFANQRDPQFSLIVDGEPLGTVVGNQYTTSNKMRQNSHSFA
jgi:hypothetical protein